MPLYYLKISHGKFAGAEAAPLDYQDDKAAWTEMATVCSDLIADVARNCAVDSNWQIETLDETKKALFRISLVAERLA